jgi:urea transport system permease protein
MNNLHYEMTSIVPDKLIQMRKQLIFGILFVAVIVIPLLGITGILEPQAVNKLGRYCTFAICAIGIDLVWGYTGILGLSQALFFTLGGYAMAMFLSLPGGGGDVRPEYNNIPQFFFFNNVDVLPVFWKPFASFPLAFFGALFIPAILAFIIGFFVFRSRVKGVYFTIITQALAWGAYLIFCRNELLLGGTNGLTNFYKPLNQNLYWITGLYLLTIVVLSLVFYLSRKLTLSRLGRLLLSIRDKEMLLNYFGYRPYLIKAFIFTIAAIIAGIGGMLYVPQNGIITPNIMRVEDSIWMVIWVALGGRGNLWGAVIGALVTNYAFSILTSDLPSVWPFIQGGLFLLVVLLFPEGFSGIYKSFEKDYLNNKFKLKRVITVPVYVVIIALLQTLGVLNIITFDNSPYMSILKYLVFGVPVVFFFRNMKSSSASVLCILTSYFFCESLGIMPNDLMQKIGAIPIKYMLLGGAVVFTALSDHGIRSRLFSRFSASHRTTITISAKPENTSVQV